jgi:hypothetical protein
MFLDELQQELLESAPNFPYVTRPHKFNFSSELKNCWKSSFERTEVFHQFSFKNWSTTERPIVFQNPFYPIHRGYLGPLLLYTKRVLGTPNGERNMGPRYLL